MFKTFGHSCLRSVSSHRDGACRVRDPLPVGAFDARVTRVFVAAPKRHSQDGGVGVMGWCGWHDFRDGRDTCLHLELLLTPIRDHVIDFGSIMIFGVPATGGCLQLLGVWLQKGRNSLP